MCNLNGKGFNKKTKLNKSSGAVNVLSAQFMVELLYLPGNQKDRLAEIVELATSFYHAGINKKCYTAWYDRLPSW